MSDRLLDPRWAQAGELARTLAERCAAADIRLASAESCTGGWIAKTFTDLPGSSDWFECGWVSYSNAAKQHMLGVRASTLQEHGAVSAQVVEEMALGALRCAGADLTVAVSGVAGPGGGSDDKPVGTVWFGWAHTDGRGRRQAHSTHAQFAGDREGVRLATVVAALEGLLERVPQAAAKGPASR